MPTENIVKLNRFTTIPFLIDLLQRRKLTLVNPNFWEDYNDRETMEFYRKKSNSNSIYALCLTHKSETVHHWNAFANGTAGCCIEFSPGRLFEILDRMPEVIHGKAVYKSLNELSAFQTDELPFFKRIPFRPENEYRIIVTSDMPQEATFDIDIDLSVIRKITISNKIPIAIFESLEKVL